MKTKLAGLVAAGAMLVAAAGLASTASAAAPAPTSGPAQEKLSQRCAEIYAIMYTTTPGSVAHSNAVALWNQLGCGKDLWT